MTRRDRKLLKKRSRGVLLALFWLPLVAWMGCAKADLSGRLESDRGDVERLRERLGQIDW